MTYSLDFRKRVLAIKDKEGLSCKETAKRFMIGVDTVLRWRRKLEPKGKHYKTPHKVDLKALEQDILKYKDAYNYERARRFKCSTTAIF